MITSLYLSHVADRIGDVGVDEGYDAVPQRYVRCIIHLDTEHKWVKEQVMPDEHHWFRKVARWLNTLERRLGSKRAWQVGCRQVVRRQGPWLRESSKRRDGFHPRQRGARCLGPQDRH